jgi:uncharacterized membrane protein YciS (DUF1049 family)
MQKFIRWVVGLPIAVIVISFAIANRQQTLISFDPFSRDNPGLAIYMPLWALFFLGLFLGMIAGWIACWFAQAKWRRSAKDARRELARVQADALEPNSTLPVQADVWS